MVTWSPSRGWRLFGVSSRPAPTCKPFALRIDPGAVRFAQRLDQLVDRGVVDRGVDRLDADVEVGAGIDSG